MYRLIEVNQDDKVLDAACGSGAFLVKAMCNMMKEAGGINTKKASEIKDYINLPVDSVGNPDYTYMESYIANKFRKTEKALHELVACI